MQKPEVKAPALADIIARADAAAATSVAEAERVRAEVTSVRRVVDGLLAERTAKIKGQARAALAVPGFKRELDVARASGLSEDEALAAALGAVQLAEARAADQFIQARLRQLEFDVAKHAGRAEAFRESVQLVAEALKDDVMEPVLPAQEG